MMPPPIPIYSRQGAGLGALRWPEGLSFSGEADAAGVDCHAPGARDAEIDPGRGLPVREVGRRCGVAASTVREMVKRFEASGLG
jgi:hypothetical protein